MANYGKRMVPEYLIKGLEEAYAKTSGGTGSTINLMDNIIDYKGNKRFIEGSLTLTKEVEGITYNFMKWSLSGTHLMIVLTGVIDNSIVVSPDDYFTVDLPKWIRDKIFTIAGRQVERKAATLTATDYSTQTMYISLTKENDTIGLYFETVTLSKRRFFRVQFDLLIDNE